YGGAALSEYIGIFDHWIAFGILLFLGIKMIKEAKEQKTCEDPKKDDPTKGLSLLVLAVATSIDSLAVGAGFGIIGLREIFLPAFIIGGITFAMTGAGFYLGRILRLYLKRLAELSGGIVLIFIGTKILAEGLGFIK
ncbi:MAG: manganese efflux pump MntP family protein, partial [Desulfatiglandales bacterium]